MIKIVATSPASLSETREIRNQWILGQEWPTCLWDPLYSDQGSHLTKRKEKDQSLKIQKRIIPLRNYHFKAGKPGKRDPGEDSRWRQPDAPEATSYYSPIQTKPKPARKLLLLPFPVSRTKPKLGQASSQATTTIARQASYTCISSSRWNTKFWPLWSWSSQMFQIQAFVVEVKSPSLGLEIKNLILGMNNF